MLLFHLSSIPEISLAGVIPILTSVIPVANLISGWYSIRPKIFNPQIFGQKKGELIVPLFLNDTFNLFPILL